MKKLLKLLRVVLIIVLSFAVLVYGGVFLGHKVFFPMESSTTPTIQPATDGTLILGAQAHPEQPTTVEGFIPILAQQLKTYNEIAPGLWPENAVVGQSLIVEKIRSSRLWLITPDGMVSQITRQQAREMGCVRNAYVDGFSFFDGGMYYAIADEDVANVLEWEKYLHLGTNDAILFLTHEGFHYSEQGKWATLDEVSNGGRDEFLGDSAARAKRELLQKQLLQAVSDPGNEQLILQAISTYEDWKLQFPDDYRNSVYFDRIEGTANYYEIVSGLYIGYPDQIKTSADLDRALSLLATRDDVYLRYGLVTEGYTVGGFACILLDRLEKGLLENDGSAQELGWKQRLMADPDATPIEMLAQHYTDAEVPLPAPQPLTQAEIDAVSVIIANKPDVKPRVFRFIYDILF